MLLFLWIVYGFVWLYWFVFIDFIPHLRIKQVSFSAAAAAAAAATFGLTQHSELQRSGKTRLFSEHVYCFSELSEHCLSISITSSNNCKSLSDGLRLGRDGGGPAYHHGATAGPSPAAPRAPKGPEKRLLVRKKCLFGILGLRSYSQTSGANCLMVSLSFSSWGTYN